MEKYRTLTQQQKAFILDQLVKDKAILNKAVELSTPIKVDVFKFESFKTEKKVFEKFYSGLELYLRLAIFLEYKYNYLSVENRDVLDFRVDKKTGKVLLVKRVNGKLKGTPTGKKYFDEITNVFEPYHIIKRWYEHFDPERPKKNVLNLAEKYSGYEDAAFNKMYKKYVDEEWISKPLWFTAEFRTTSKGEKQTMEEYYQLHP